MSPRRAVAGSLRVGVSAELQHTPTGDIVRASAFLELPLDRWAAPRRLQEFAEDSAPKTEEAPRRTKAASVAIPRLNARLVSRLVRAALRVERTEDGNRHLAELESRARLSAALPELMLRGLRSNDQSLRWSPAGTADTYDYTQSGGAGYMLEARAIWKLDRLVFADDEIRLERYRLMREERRERLVALVLRELVAWQSARLRQERAELSPDEALSAELAESEAAVELDWLTDGLFAEVAEALLPASGTAAPGPRAP